DAVVQASHPENVNESNRVYNTKIFEQNSQRNILGDNIKKLDFMLGDLMKQIKNGDKDAQKEFDNIQRRMSSSEEITIKNYTYSYQNGKEIGLYVRSPKLYMNKGQYNGTLVFDGKSTDGSNVDILEKIFDNGDQIIKEVYWQNNRSTKEREVMKTVVKTIVDETMTVTEVHKKKYSKGERGKQSEQVISAFKIEYEIIGSKQIKKFNERVHGTNIVPAKNSFIMPNLTTEFVPIEKNNYKLIDIIANEKLAVKGGTKLNTEVKNTKLSQEFKTYEASVSGADFKSESDRLFLPIMEIMKHIKSVDSFLSTRHKNLSGHEWFIAHAAISDTTPEAVGNLKSEYESVDTKGIELFLQKVARKNIANNIRYLNEKVYRLGDTPYEYNNDHIKTVKNGMELAFKSTFKTSYLIGAEKNTALRSIYEDISLHNSGSYDKTSVITVLGRDGNAVKQNGQLVSDYKNIDKAIKKDASFVLELISLDFQTTMNSVGRLKLTDGALIKYFYQINSKKKGKFTKDLQHEKSKYQLQNYLLNNGYKSRLENGILVFSPKDLGYNSKIKSNYEARQIVENIMNCK
ncbi:MAG: hypothetical protein KAH01_07295, partial [Caldisericia bacterium]|nr:hypothetical protein [Caldisericia bacterium]